MSSAAQLRSAFIDFIGKERFRRFIGCVGYDQGEPPTMRFWQEKCWGEFRERFPQAPTNRNEMSELLLWCYVHDRKLELAHEFPQFPDIRRTSEWVAAINELFPFSLNCPDCWAAHNAWIAANDCSILRRKTSWEEYCTTHGSKNTHEFRCALNTGHQIIQSDMQAGDELWEYDHGFGQTGLAIVRGGEAKILWSAPLE